MAMCAAPCRLRPLGLVLQALSLVLDVLCGITSKEEDAAVREALAEAVLCLARVDSARKQLWKCDAPTLLKTGCVCAPAAACPA
jgi:hypothetical protein